MFIKILVRLVALSGFGDISDWVPLAFKEIESRDFGWLQMILMNSIWVPDVRREISFFNFLFLVFFHF